MNLQAPRGTVDLLPEQMALRQQLEQTARGVFREFNYHEIRTPMFEDTQLFVRSIGEATDIVEKEMYTIPRGDDEESLTLRPEGTAGIVRAYVEQKLDKRKKFQKFFYIGPMFRYERPQAGRLRQFHQIGVEVLGTYDAMADAETIVLASTLFQRIGLKDFEIGINSIGNDKSRDNYRRAVRKILEGRREELCENCKQRIERNVFRVLDCKQPQCAEVVKDLPPIREYLEPECLNHFGQLLESLAKAGVSFKIDQHLVRGLDYYTRTVYEISHSSLGARSAVCGGGRYDHLVEEIGGPPTGCVGFAIGVEATELALRNSKETPEVGLGGIDYYIVTVDESCRIYAFEMLGALRRSSIRADMDFEGRSIKAQMRSADKAGARYAVIVGPDEMKADKVMLRRMADSTQETMPRGEFLARHGAQG